MIYTKKEIIISFILGAIISSVVGVIAANTISSSSVLYKDDKTVNTVLDELFENVDAIESDNTKLTSLEGKLNTLTSTHSSDITRIDNSIDELNNGITNLSDIELIYQNDNASSITSGTVMSFDTTKYRFFVITGVTLNGAWAGSFKEIIPANTEPSGWKSYTILKHSPYNAELQFAWRTITITDAGITFNEGYASGDTAERTNAIVPTRIYGIK